MINQQISDMMRQCHFRERMEELGYSNKPIVAVDDWGAETISTHKLTIASIMYRLIIWICFVLMTQAYKQSAFDRGCGCSC